MNIASSVFKRIRGVREDLHCVMDAELYYRILADGGKIVRADGLVGAIREQPEAKGVARRADWEPEGAKVFSETGVSRRRVRAARMKMRFCRLFDGSYLRSWRLLREWKGRKAWSVCQQNGEY